MSDQSSNGGTHGDPWDDSQQGQQGPPPPPSPGQGFGAPPPPPPGTGGFGQPSPPPPGSQWGSQPEPQWGSQPGSQWSQPGPQWQSPPGQPYGGQQYGYQQPAAVPYGGMIGAKPDTNLVWAILSTVLCCMPFGIAAIVYAAKVDSLWNQGDQAGSERASRLARNWSIASAATGVVVMVIYVALIAGGSSGY